MAFRIFVLVDCKLGSYGELFDFFERERFTRYYNVKYTEFFFRDLHKESGMMSIVSIWNKY